MNSRCRLALLLTTQLFVVAADAADGLPPGTGNAEHGATRSTELFCTACHGAGGVSTTPEWPSLAGQPVSYLSEQLLLFRAKRRFSLEMQPLAASLTDPDVADLAAWFSAQELVPTVPASAIDADSERLYREGDPSRGLAGCASCHGKEGRGDVTLGAPALRGQQAVYMVKQLQGYARRSRYPQDAPAAAVAMAEVASRLTARESTALADWLQHQP